MRTNIEIDEELLRQAIKATGAKTKKAAVEAAMRLTVQLKARKASESSGESVGKVTSDTMRESRFLDKDGFFRQDTRRERFEGKRPGRRRHSEPENRCQAEKFRSHDHC